MSVPAISTLFLRESHRAHTFCAKKRLVEEAILAIVPFWVWRDLDMVWGFGIIWKPVRLLVNYRHAANFELRSEGRRACGGSDTEHWPIRGRYIQWCPDISPGPVQPGSGTIRGVGLKTVRFNKFTFSHWSMLNEKIYTCPVKMA